MNAQQNILVAVKHFLDQNDLVAHEKVEPNDPRRNLV